MRIAPTKQPTWRRDGGLSCRHRLRADHPDHVDVRRGEEADEQPDLGMPLERERIDQEVGGDCAEVGGVRHEAPFSRVEERNVNSAMKYTPMARKRPM
jgi:hypothetical protein